MTLRAAPALAAAAATTLLALHGCAPRPEPPVSLRAVQAEQIDAAADVEYRRLDALPAGEYRFDPARPRDAANYDPVPRVRRELDAGTDADIGEGLPIATTQPADSARVVGLPLRECVRRATLNNFDVAVAAYEPAIAETRIVEAEARFDPVFQLTGEYQNQNQVNPDAGNFGETERLTASAALTQLLPSGSQLQLQYQTIYNDFKNNPFLGLNVPNPSYTSGLTLQFQQPILRNFGFDTNRARIFINQNDQRISVLEFRDRLEEVLLQVEQTYWQLFEAQRQVEIQEELLERTLETGNIIRIRAGQDASREQVSRALAEALSRRADLIEAKGRVAQLSDELLRLMNDPDLPVAGDVLVRTTSEPVEAPLLFDLEDATATALSSRPELAQQILRIDSARSAERVGRSNLLPQLDLVLSGGLQGIADDYAGSVDDQFSGDGLSAGVGLQLEIPLGNRGARATLKRALNQRDQAVTQYQALVQQVAAEVSQTQRQASVNYARLTQLREARLAIRDVVEQLGVEERADPRLTPEFVDRKLRTLSQLLQAQSNEAGAIAEYQRSLAEYERAKGTLLRYNNIVIEEAARGLKLPAGRVAPRQARER